MLIESMIGMMRRRWQTSRPFEGHTRESLLRKIECPAVREAVKEQARQELRLRCSEPYAKIDASSWQDARAGFGAIPTEARVVRDRNRITGAGVTAGLDFGLTMVAGMRDPAYAGCCQLMSEYGPLRRSMPARCRLPVAGERADGKDDRWL